MDRCLIWVGQFILYTPAQAKKIGGGKLFGTTIYRKTRASGD